MQPARNLVCVIVELASGMQFGHDDLHRRNMLLWMHVHGNASSVVPDRHAVVQMQHDFDARAEPRHGFVDGVVHHFIDKMVQSPGIRAADIHGRAFPYRLESFKNGDRVSCIGFGCHRLMNPFG